MDSMRSAAHVLVVALLGSGCGDDVSISPDADVPVELDANIPPGPCWPDVARIPRGSATLGTGRDGFETMPDELPLEYGSQDGFMLIANVRMTGFPPGNAQNILDPANPRTRIHAYFDETNVPLNFYAHCPFRNAYVPAGSEYQLVEAAPIIFETCWRSEHLFGKRIRIELELLTDDGAYTTDVKVVTAVAPTSLHPIDQGQPGCIHP